jgi:integrase/recombinase XerD
VARTRYALSIQYWPKIDRAAWTKALQDADLFGERGIEAHWADATRAQVANGYGMWLHFLEAIGALQHDVMPTSRLSADRLAAYVESLKARSLSPISVASRLRDLAEALRVMDTGGDRTVLVRGLSG